MHTPLFRPVVLKGLSGYCLGIVSTFLVIIMIECILTGICWLEARIDRRVEQFHRTKKLSCLTFTCLEEH
jgi:hypothetical protein